LGVNYARRLEKALNEFEERQLKSQDKAGTVSKLPIASDVQPPQIPTDFRPRDPSLNTSMNSQEGMIVNTADERRSTLTTTINPRLRPKASSNVSGILPPPVTAVSFINTFDLLILVSSFTYKVFR
jgi:hypothetical protein